MYMNCGYCDPCPASESPDRECNLFVPTENVRGSDSDYLGIYDIGEAFLPPSVSIEPLKSIKDAAVSGVNVVKLSGLDDQIGVVSYAGTLMWSDALLFR